MIAALARDLVAEARTSDERRLLVLAGGHEETLQAAATALEAAGLPTDETTVVSGATDTASDLIPATEQLPIERAGDLLGRTRQGIVLDCHETLRPNTIGRTVGAVDGGGLYVLCTPPLDEWAGQRDAMDEWLAVPPFTVDDVSGRFRARTVELLRTHPGVAIVDVDAERIERDGLTEPAPRRARVAPSPPATHTFPDAAYDACLTEDQVQAVHTFESLAEPGSAIVLDADRGRGKSAAAGLAAASLAVDGADVLVTAPQYRSASEVFDRASALLSTLDATVDSDRAENPHRLSTAAGRIRFERPSTAVSLPDDPDVVIVDEAAALPVRRLTSFLAAPAVAFTTTIHGYEGAGRGFSVRFRDRLAESEFAVSDVTMTTPIRYAVDDPIETWAFRTLLLDARPAVDPVVATAAPETSEYERLSSEKLVADEHLLRETFGLLVLAHYRTEPDDFARLLDAPNVSVRALVHDGHVVSVALLAREGNLPADRRREMYEGGRIRGNMIPDVLTTQLRDEDAGIPVGQRVLRIATHPAVRSRGLGSSLLAEIRDEFAADVDWLGTGFGATPELVDFWTANDYHAVHLSTTRNDASGEHSAVMLSPTSDAGRSLARRHADWFRDRVESALTDALSMVDPDVVRSVLRSIDADYVATLSDLEWRLVAGVPRGAATVDTAPGPFRRLCLAHFVGDGDGTGLDADVERVLVRKVLQAQGWEAVAAEFDYVSTAECKRAVGRAIRALVESQGPSVARAELDDTNG